MPAAAVIRRVQALIGITGRKARVGGLTSWVKSPGLTWELHSKLAYWSTEEASRIHGVAVKCVDIMRNTNGEGNSLVRN